MLVRDATSIFSSMKAYDPIAQLIKEHERALQKLHLLNRTTDELIEDGFSIACELDALATGVEVDSQAAAEASHPVAASSQLPAQPVCDGKWRF